MSVADQSAPASRLPRRVPLAIRLSPQFVNRLCAHLLRSADSRMDLAGLLFGVADDGLMIVQAFKSFPVGNLTVDTPEQARLEQGFEELAKSSQTDPEVSALDVIGWYSTRLNGGLRESDVEFHNRRLRRRSDIALIVTPQQAGDLVLELFSRAADAPLSTAEYRWAAQRVSPEAPVAGVVEVTMQTRGSGDLQAQPSIPSQENEPRPSRGRSRRTALSILGSSMGSREENGDAGFHLATAPMQRISVRQARPADQAHVDQQRASRIYAGPPPGLPALISEKRRGVPWFSMTILFVLAAGMTFALLVLRGLPSGEAPRFLRTILPDSGLRLRVEGQGDRVLLSWNRLNPVVRSATDATLHIDDGSQHRDVRLDSGQVANGAVLYRPGSDDVTFRLEVHGQQGSMVAESMRVLDGQKSASVVDLSATKAEVNTPPVLDTVQPPAERHDRRIAAETRPLAPPLTQTAERSRSAIAERASSPDVPAQNDRGTVSPAYLPPASAPPAAAPEMKPVPAETNPAPGSGGLTNPVGVNATTAKSTQSAAAAPPAPEPAPVQTADTAHSADQAPNSVKSDIAAGNQQASSAANVKPAEARPPANVVPNPVPTQTAPPAQSPLKAVSGNKSMADYVPPRPLKEVLPNVQILPPGIMASVSEVEVNVEVDKKGHVLRARIVPAHGKIAPAIEGAALDAAKRWTFEPAKLHGKIIPSAHTIVFQFQSARQ